MICSEASELITALVDDELSGRERAAVEGHLRGCSRCRVLYRQEGELKKCLHALAARVVVPAGLRERILADPRTFPRPTRAPWAWIRDLWPSGTVARPAFALAVLVLLIMPVYYLVSPTGASIPLAAMEVHAKIQSGVLPFTRDGSAGQTVARLAGSVGDRFAPMGHDLSAAGLKPVGGIFHRVDTRDVLVAVYQGEAPAVSCFTFIGTERDVPPGARLVIDAEEKKNYYTFSDGTLNAVMHQADNRVCLLVSQMPMDGLLNLARSVRHSIKS